MPRVTSLACLFVLWAVGPVCAQPDPAANDNVARGLFQAGTAAYDAGDYKGALQLYEQAYARSPRPQLLFNIGQAADRLRMDDTALRAFSAYLDQVPDAPNHAAVQQRVNALQESQRVRKEQAALLSAAAAATPAPAAAAPVTPTASAAVEPQPPTRAAPQPLAAPPTPAQTAASFDAGQSVAATPSAPPGNTSDAGSHSEPVTKKWWFWTGVGAAVVGGTVVALALMVGGGGASQPAPYQGNAGSVRGP
jgi:tetratricopeptide (TPR) repeat protein